MKNFAALFVFGALLIAGAFIFLSSERDGSTSALLGVEDVSAQCGGPCIDQSCYNNCISEPNNTPCECQAACTRACPSPPPPPPPPPASHRACSGTSCVSVAGAGSDQCGAVGPNAPACGHYGCSSGSCSFLAGNGSNVCSGNGDCTSKRCQGNGSCAEIAGTGSSNCNSVCGGANCAPQCSAPPPPSPCGNAKCEGGIGESCTTCPQDCGTCPISPSCGDKVCGKGESCLSCDTDCGKCPVQPPPPPPSCEKDPAACAPPPPPPPPPPPLRVDLQLDTLNGINWRQSLSGPAPLANVDYRARASGGDDDEGDYYFWWDCANTSRSITTVQALCGVLTVPPRGTCVAAISGKGYMCRQIDEDDEPEIFDAHTYATAGSYTAKVIVDRDGTAEDRAAVIVSSAPVCVSTCTVSGQQQCLDATHYQVCNDSDADGCLEWSPGPPGNLCGTSQLCRVTSDPATNGRCQNLPNWQEIPPTGFFRPFFSDLFAPLLIGFRH